MKGDSMKRTILALTLIFLLSNVTLATAVQDLADLGSPANNSSSSSAGTQIDPAGNVLSASPSVDFYIVDTPTSPISYVIVGLLATAVY